jgi:GntR family transcriptional regulator
MILFGQVILEREGSVMTEDGKIESLVSALREQIKRGDFGTRGRLPSVTQLAKDHQIARTTVYNALQILRNEGLLIVKDTAAFFVNSPVLQIVGTPNFDDYLRKQGLIPKVTTIGIPDIITIPDEIAAMFETERGIQVIHRLRVQGTSEIPIRLEENWYPTDLAQQFLDAMRNDPDINVAREIRLAHNIAITRIKEDVLSRYPSQEEAKLLGITRTSPVLEARRNFLTHDKGRTVIYNRTIMVAAFCKMHYEYDTSFEKAQVDKPYYQ